MIFLVEATWRAHTGDVDRQVCRRDVLQSRGVETVALIASVEPPSDDILGHASLHGVVIEPAPGATAA